MSTQHKSLASGAAAPEEPTLLDSPFDAMAADYDAAFSRSLLGARMRQAVWQRLAAHFGPGDRVLELGCGTGEDALYLARRGVRVVATDASVGMLEVAQAKARAAGLAQAIVTEHLPIEDLARIATGEGIDERGRENRAHTYRRDSHAFGSSYDGILSNFGALNCVADLPAVAAGMARRLQPGSVAVLCIMGPLVPWEWAWYLGRGQGGKAFRRLRPAGVAWRGLTIRYPSIAALQRAFAPYFRTTRVAAVGALLPPSYAEIWAQRHHFLLHALHRIERRFETTWPLPWLADHYVIELVRAG